MELDDAYANAAYIDGAEAYPQRWQTTAGQFRDSLGDRADLAVPYGDSARQVYDLFHPEGPSRGIALFVHGGYWLKFDRSFWSHLAAGPLARGWAVAMPSYDLCPDVPIAGITRQIAAAVQAVAARATGPIALTGHSAGGHLVARMLDPAVLPAPVAARVSTVIPISPVADLRPLLQTAMNTDLRLDRASAEAESPVLMTHRHPARVSVRVGENERPAFLQQARQLARAWQSDLVIAPGRHHFDVIDALADPDSALTQALTQA